MALGVAVKTEVSRPLVPWSISYTTVFALGVCSFRFNFSYYRTQNA